VQHVLDCTRVQFLVWSLVMDRKFIVVDVYSDSHCMSYAFYLLANAIASIGRFTKLVIDGRDGSVVWRAPDNAMPAT
jgi:hypothetical protein